MAESYRKTKKPVTDSPLLLVTGMGVLVVDVRSVMWDLNCGGLSATSQANGVFLVPALCTDSLIKRRRRRAQSDV